MAVKRRRLTDAHIARLAPAAREYTVWDTRHAGFGVRVRPSGHRSLVYWRKSEDGARRITLGSAALISVEEARNQCLAIETGTRADGQDRGTVPTFGEFAAGPGRSCFDRGKPSTRKITARIVAARLLPVFGTLRLDRITRAGVTRWFDECSRTTPDAANRALNLFGRIMNHAIVCGHLQTNPARGIKWNPRPRLTRFLSRDEIQRLHLVLDRYVGARPSRARQADVIRLLLLTGCRKSEILTLRWQDIDGDALNLTHAKTGPRRVFLNTPASTILERQSRSVSGYVFPSSKNPGRPLSCHLPLWNSVRKEAGIEDVRLHDLRHTYASHAVLQGVPLPVVSRLLGHKQPSMTLRYAHVGDRETEAAAERIGAAIARALGLGPQLHPSDASSGSSSG